MRSLGWLSSSRATISKGAAHKVAPSLCFLQITDAPRLLRSLAPVHSSRAVVVSRTRRGLTRNAGDRAQIFVDSTQVVVRHVVIDRPWHYLEKSAVERGWQTIPVGGAGTGWMEVIHVYACPYDPHKLRKRMTSFRQSSFVRGQIARDDVWKWTWSGKGTKIPAPTQVSRRVNLSWLPKVWVATRGEFGSRASAVATIAVALCVDNVAAESHQCAVLSVQIQRDRGDLETNLNL